jgi:hypothetical protein
MRLRITGFIHWLNFISQLRFHLMTANKGLYSPAAHHESAVASGNRLRTTGLYSPAAHHESVWLRVSDCGQRLLTCWASESDEAGGIRLRTTGLFSPAAHHESAVASGNRLRTSWGCFHLLCIMSLLRLQVSDCEQRGCFTSCTS